MARGGRGAPLPSGGLPGVGPGCGATRRGGVAFVIIGAALLGAAAVATRSHYPLFVLLVQVPATVGMALKELRRLM